MKTAAYWVTTILGPASFVIGGYLHLTRDPQAMATLAHLGYPPYVATIMGFWKLAGAVAIVAPGFPRVKEWAYAGFFFDLTGAAATRAFVGDGIADIIAPLGFLALVMASRALQPARRGNSAERRSFVGSGLRWGQSSYVGPALAGLESPPEGGHHR